MEVTQKYFKISHLVLMGYPESWLREATNVAKLGGQSGAYRPNPRGMWLFDKDELDQWLKARRMS